MVTILILGILAAIAVAIFDTVTVNLSCDRPDPGGCPAPDGNWG